MLGLKSGYGLADLAMECPAAQELVELHLFQTPWGVEALFVTSGNVTRRRLTLSSGFGAFEDDDVSRHIGSVFKNSA